MGGAGCSAVRKTGACAAHVVSPAPRGSSCKQQRRAAAGGWHTACLPLMWWCSSIGGPRALALPLEPTSPYLTRRCSSSSSSAWHSNYRFAARQLPSSLARTPRERAPTRPVSHRRTTGCPALQQRQQRHFVPNQHAALIDHPPSHPSPPCSFCRLQPPQPAAHLSPPAKGHHGPH